MVIIIGSLKPIIESRASDFGWPDWPAGEKVKHDPWLVLKGFAAPVALNSTQVSPKHNPVIVTTAAYNVKFW